MLKYCKKGGRNKRIRKTYIKKYSFMKAWAKVIIPLAALTIVVLIFGTNLVLALDMNAKLTRAMEISWEQSAAIESIGNFDIDITSNQEQFLEHIQPLLNMEIFNMVAILYDLNGQKVACSKVNDSNSIYVNMLSTIENTGVKGELTQEINLYGYSYLYDGREVNIGNEIYIFQYAAVIDTWQSHTVDFILIWCIIISFIVLLSLIIANNFYRTYQMQLKEEQRHRDKTNAMAHDLKTPLMAIYGYVENLRENVHTEKKDYYTEAILKNASYMNDIVENMLELAKVENIETIVNKEKINFQEITEQVLEQYQFDIKEKDLQVDVQGEVSIDADKELMKRVLENLIGNAVKYTPNKQKISIEMNNNRYKITNMGVTIDASQLEEIWKPFVKGDSSRGSGNGTGIGLALVKEILDAHSFKYFLSSNNDSVTVTISF